MKKRLSLSLLLLTGAIYGGGFVQGTIAKPVSPIVAQTQETPQPQATPSPDTSPQATPSPGTSPQATPSPGISPQPQAAPGATLTLQDLPPGFQAVPPQTTANVVEMLRKQLGPISINPQNLFAFISQPNGGNSSGQTSAQNGQILVGYTGAFADKAAQDKFDQTLKQMQQPDAQRQLIEQFRAQLKNSANVEIQEYSTIPELNNLAEVSTGMTLKIMMSGQPWRIDIASFRRNSTGAMTAIVYPDGQQPRVSLTEIARKLDGKIAEITPAMR